MSELPDGWVRTPLGNLLTSIVGGGTPSKAIGENFLGSIPFMTVKDMHERFIEDTQDHITEKALAESASTVVPANTLIVASRMSLGKIARPKVPVAINQDLKALFLHDGVDKTYVEYAWRANESAIKARGTGTTVKGIRLEDIRGLEVAVAPSKEQTRIADQLDTLLARIQACNDRLDAIPALLKRFRGAVLDAAITGKLSREWRDSFALSAAESAFPQWAASMKLHNLPLGWRWSRFSEFVNTLRSGTSAVPGNDQTEYPVLRSSSVRPMGIDLDDVRYLTSLQKVRNEDLLADEDLLFTRLSGSLDYVANCVLVRGLGARRIYYPDRLFRARLKNPRLGPYAELCFSSPLLRKHLTVEAKSSAGHQRISMGAIRDFPIPLPEEDEQRVIIERVERLLDVAERIGNCQAAAVAKTQRLMPLTLAKAFRGELVQQDPNDEPASVLLQRIAATPTTAMKTPRGRPRTKQPNKSTTLPTMHPDWAALPAGAWAGSGQTDEHATTALLIAVLKAWGQPMPQDQARLAAVLCLQPRLFTAALPAHDATSWRRLVGAEAEPLPASVAAMQPVVNTHWRRALAGLRARGDLMASGSGPQGSTWALGPGADRVDTAGWPDGRAGWVVAYLRAHGIEAVLPSLASAALDFVHARAA